MKRHQLTDDQWKLLAPFFPPRPPKPGGQWKDDRRMLDGILLLAHLPAEPGLCILFVLHLHPRMKSELSRIFGTRTGLTVVEAAEGMKVEENHVYVIPPAQTLGVIDGHLGLTPRPPHGPHMPADYLFRSMADVHKSRAIGVLLSGTGSDGTIGFQAIKAEGGITFAQDDMTARHQGMPRSAVHDGHVDYVLSPAEIA